MTSVNSRALDCESLPLQIALPSDKKGECILATKMAGRAQSRRMIGIAAKKGRVFVGAESIDVAQQVLNRKIWKWFIHSKCVAVLSS
jgi:hypothetical protein